MVKFVFLSLLGLASVAAAAATPRSERKPRDFQPGPGWPSLADLNMTVAELYALPPPDEATRAEARALYARDKGEQGKCGPVERAYTSAEDVVACYNFVTRAWHEGMVFQAAEGHRPHSICRSLNEQSIIAVSGEIYKNGVMAGSVPRDVGIAIIWILDHCTRNGKDVAGVQAANGNGDLLVHAMKVSYFDELQRTTTP